MVRYESPMVPGVVAWCVEPHDLWLSKAVANRPKDIEYCRAMVRLGLVEVGVLRERSEAIPDLSDAVRGSVTALIESSAQ